MTFFELNEQYLHGYLKAHASYGFYCRLYRQYFSGWCEHPTKKQIRDWHRAHNPTPAHANKGLGYLKAMYNWAINEDLWNVENPAAGIRRHPQHSRERTVSARELSLLLNALDFMPWKFRTLLLMLLLTGCRLSEACTARWEHLDLDAGSWYKPKTKNGRPQRVPISRQLATTLRQLPRSGPYLFAGLYDRHYSRAGAEKAWWSVRDLLGLGRKDNAVRLHDFRRTVATRLHEQGEPELLIKSVLNHHVEATNVTAVYIRPSFDRQAAALQTYADRLYALIQEVPHDTQTGLPFLSPGVERLCPAQSV
jgi:integrase